MSPFAFCYREMFVKRYTSRGCGLARAARSMVGRLSLCRIEFVPPNHFFT
jgi:hypothetical protein